MKKIHFYDVIITLLTALLGYGIWRILTIASGGSNLLSRITAADLKDAGSVIAAVVTHFGVVASYVLNPIIQRNAELRKYEAENRTNLEKLDHERMTLRAILHAELDSVFKPYREESRYSAQLERGGARRCHTFVPIGFFSAFKSRAETIGLLSAAEAGAVMHAFYVWQERTSYIIRNAGASFLSALQLPCLDCTSLSGATSTTTHRVDPFQG